MRVHWAGVCLWLIVALSVLCWAAVLAPIHLLGVL
jgi:hypothetical protein